MDLILLLSLLFMLYPYIAYSSIEVGSVLIVGEEWSSPHGTFALGFRSVPSSKASFNLAIWYQIDEDKTVVWMASKKNGEIVQVSGSAQLQLRQGTGLAITDDYDNVVWQPESTLPCCASASLLETGNLIVYSTDKINPAWQSFDHPTTTILPGQPLRTPSVFETASLLSPSQNYALHINRAQAFLQTNNNAIAASKRYWHIQNPEMNTNKTCLDDNGNQVENPLNCQASPTLNSSAVLNLSSQGLLTFYDATGNINWYKSPSENPHKYALDYGDPEVLMRKLSLEDDGNLRIYSFVNSTKSWRVSGQALLKECDVFGICGPFGLCSYRPHKTCSCPPGFHHINPHDDSKGCEYDVPLSSTCNSNRLVLVNRADYYYNDYNLAVVAYSIEECKTSCLQDCKCLAAAYKPNDGLCFHKGDNNKIYNGMQSLDMNNIVFLKLSAGNLRARDEQHDFFESNANATLSSRSSTGEARKSYFSQHFHGIVAGIAISEFVLFVAVLASSLVVFERRARRNWKEMMAEVEGAPTSFTYQQLEEATRGFSEVLGSGGCGVVYRGEIAEKGGTVAVKVIKAATQAEKQFKTEVATIGRIHHVNLVRLLGYCVEGAHRLLVYEFMPNGSLDSYLFGLESIDWQTRIDITLGIAKGIAYLHEKCRECILHCDIKPQNVLLDKQMSPKIADFGLAKLLKENASLAVTTIRGTRGYVAPEWLDGQSITSKVDVYSFGMLLLDILMGSNKVTMRNQEDPPAWLYQMFVDSNLRSIVDPQLEMSSTINWDQVETVLKVALWCINHDPNSRPSMSRVVQMLEARSGQEFEAVMFASAHSVIRG